MEHAQSHTTGIRQQIVSTLLIAKQILLNPTSLFRNMEHRGGFTAPLLFMLSVGFISGLFKVFVTFVHMANGAKVSLFSALSALVITPLSVVCFGYICAFILAIIMRQLGCDGEVETAFRVVSYLSVISPIAIILSPIPYVGNLLILGILTYLIVAAVIEVYQLSSNTAWLVFGLGLTVIALAALGSEFITRNHSPSTTVIEQSATTSLPIVNH